MREFFGLAKTFLKIDRQSACRTLDRKSVRPYKPHTFPLIFMAFGSIEISAVNSPEVQAQLAKLNQKPAVTDTTDKKTLAVTEDTSAAVGQVLNVEKA
jgi:hypothetical protein